jgi:hypothetical protein
VSSKHWHVRQKDKQSSLGKSLIDPPTIGGGLVYPSTMKRSNLPPELCKTGQITLSSGFGRRFATVTTVLLQ